MAHPHGVRPLMTRADIEHRFISSVIKDGDGQRWRECRNLSPEAFEDWNHRKAWREIVDATNYESAAMAGRSYFKHDTCGEAYPDDRDSIFIRWLQLRGLSFARDWIAALPIKETGISHEMPWDTLLTFDSRDDRAALMGKRYLCRTGAVVIAAPSGMGKSVLAAQLGGCASLGRPFFGLQMAFPMRVLYVQAEDDVGDVAEAVQGFVGEYGIVGEELAQLRQRMRIVRWNDAAGERFLARLRAEYRAHPFDLVIINPLFSFCGCGVSDQEKMSAFLRNGLNPILNETGAACALIHHTNKPKEDEKPGKGDEELRYEMSGSGEITNWARAVISLKQVKAAGAHVYKMSFAKRGRRAGLVDAEGKPTTSVLLEHSTRGLCWLPSDYAPTKNATGRFQAKFDLPRARLHYDPDIPWVNNEAAIAKDQNVSTRTVRTHKRTLETAA
jgi:hypothetical protein